MVQSLFQHSILLHHNLSGLARPAVSVLQLLFRSHNTTSCNERGHLKYLPTSYRISFGLLLHHISISLDRRCGWKTSTECLPAPLSRLRTVLWPTLNSNNQEMAAQREGLDVVEVPSRFSAISSAQLPSGPLICACADRRRLGNINAQTRHWSFPGVEPCSCLHYLWA